MEKHSTEIRTVLTGILLTFIILKLTGVIHWSWLWVLAPFWITFLFSVTVIFVLLTRRQTRR